MGYFEDYEISFHLGDTPNSGFRPGQLGALHSTLAHFSVYEEPALLSLPTGYGKTAILMALPFILKSKRVLVLEPSDALRKQTSSHFVELSTLRKLTAVCDVVPNPKVLSQKGRPVSSEEWSTLEDFDVIVSTPQSISPALGANPSNELFDLILVDEAHHIPAETWSAFLEYYSKAKFVFLTATPFRRDRKNIPGRMAYWYPVNKASKESAFGKVKFVAPRIRDDNDDDEIDRSIARTAVLQLRSDQDAGYDHRIFARASSISSARKLVAIYENEGANIKAVTSHIAKSTQDKIEADLISGALDGVICVDMFGEGYDFPKLKIAALHAPHRSLVPTLQFIGRFARTSDSSTGDATLVAPLSRLKEASKKLFKEGVNIAELIDEVAQEQIADAEADREVLEALKTVKQIDSDYDAVTPLLLKLYAHTEIYDCEQPPDFSLFADLIANKLQIVKQWTSEDGLITLLLTLDISPPNWATSDVLVNTRHDAFLLAYNEASNLCFIGTTRKTKKIYLDLMQTVCPDHFRHISYERIRQALNGLTALRFYNVGLRNTALNSQAESYRTMTGPNAERAITAGDARAYTQGHFFGSGVGEGDVRETIGASSSSRIWSNKRLTVAEYLEWATSINNRLNGNLNIAVSQLDLIQHARTLTRVPEKVIAASWHKQAYRLSPKIRYRQNVGQSWRSGTLIDLEIEEFVVSADNTDMTFLVRSGETQFQFRFGLRGQLFTQVSSGNIEVMAGIEDWEDMAIWLSSHPPVFYSSDKSSFQGVNLIGAASNTISQLWEQDTQPLNWEGCAIDVEFDVSSANNDSVSVHQWLENHLLQMQDLQVLLYDHRSGEIADYIAFITDGNGSVRIQLYHCKAAGGEPSGGRVGDVYEVAGQMLKSVAYCDTNILIDKIVHRTNPGRQKTPSRFVIGDIDTVTALLNDTPATDIKFEIYAVQPGISERVIDSHLADLMAFGIDYVQRGGAAKAAWLINL